MSVGYTRAMRRRLNHPKKLAVYMIVVGGLVMVSQLQPLGRPIRRIVIQNQPGLYKVVFDIDGDTLVVDMNGKPEKIRLIGVDTPETHDPRKPVQCYGLKAAALTKSKTEKHVIRLVADPLSTNRDRYSRLLRYVYLQDGTFWNEQLIRLGYGFAYTGFPFSRSEQFINDQTYAQKQHLGLWHDCTPTRNPYGGYTSNQAN